MFRRRIAHIPALLVAAAAAAAAQVRRPKQFLNIGDKKPPGYTHVVTSPPGRMIFVSGQGGTDASGKLAEGFADQTEYTFQNIGRCLELAGATFKDIVKINYFVTDMANLGELRRIRAKYLNMDAPPAATLVQSGLVEGLLVEIECVAIVPE